MRNHCKTCYNHSKINATANLGTADQSLVASTLVQYKLLRQVGKGSYGKVYRALERSTNATLAFQLVDRVPTALVTAAPGFCEGPERAYHRSAA